MTMDTTVTTRAIQATMSLRQKVRFLSRRAISARAAIAAWLVEILVAKTLSSSMSDSSRECAACSSSVMGASELEKVRQWYLIEHGRTCPADDPVEELTDYGLAVHYAGRLLRHANAIESQRRRSAASPCQLGHSSSKIAGKLSR